MAGGGSKPRPEYYALCISFAALLGFTDKIIPIIQKSAFGPSYKAKWSGYMSFYMTWGRACEGALEANGWGVRRRQLVRIR